MKIAHTLKSLANDELLRRLFRLSGERQRVEAELVAHIAEVDERRLYADEAASSMFAYCTERLHLSEGEAFLRIQVARATRRHPVLLDALADGRVHLTGLGKLVPHLTPENRDELLERATHRSKREIEELVAELQPRPDVPTSMRKLSARGATPEPRPDEVGDEAANSVGGVSGGKEPRPDEVERQPRPPSPPRAPTPAVQPLAPERYRIQFTADAALRNKLERLQALMRSSVPDGDLAAIIGLLVSEKLERLEARRFGKVEKPRKNAEEADTSPGSRAISAAVRRAVHERDGGRCTFRDEAGRQCRAREGLEYHHDHAFARGGHRGVANIRLLCCTHNLLMAERDYGKRWMGRFRRPRLEPSPPGP